MDGQINDGQKAPEVNEIIFPNGNRAKLVVAQTGDKPEDLLKALGIRSPKGLIWMTGSAGSLKERSKPYLGQLFSRGVISAALDREALLMDGGTRSGLMAVMGEALADRDYSTVLLGVAPAGLAKFPGGPDLSEVPDAWDLDPNHTHFILVPGQEFGSETPWMIRLIESLSATSAGSPTSQGTTPGKAAAVTRKQARTPGIPVVTVLVGGKVKGISRREVTHTVRHGWPLVVIEGSGELANLIARYLRNPNEPIKQPELAEILDDGRLCLYRLEDPAKGFRQLILRQFGEDEILRQAWRRFAVYDQQAKRYSRWFNWLQFIIVALGVLTTLLVIISTLLNNNDPTSWLYVTVLLLPIGTSAFLAFATRLNPGNKWVMLRSSAEAIKRAIFLYRTRPITYPRAIPKENQQEVGENLNRPDGESEDGTKPVEDQVPREAELARRIEFITRQLLQTDVNLSALPPYEEDKPIPPGNSAHPDDDGLSFLTPEQYIKLRLEHQLHWFQSRTTRKEVELRLFQAFILLVGAAGTFLAAINQEIWVALTTSIVTALTTVLSYRQTESTLIQYNQTATSLENIKAWWLSLPPEEQALRATVEQLVKTSERVLESEQTGWMQQMQDALASLREEKGLKGSEEEPQAPGRFVTLTPEEEPEEEEEAGVSEEKQTPRVNFLEKPVSGRMTLKVEPAPEETANGAPQAEEFTPDDAR